MKDRNAIPKQLLWLDLEMTGLDPDKQRIIEVAAIVTDFDFNEIEMYEAVIHQTERVLKKSDKWVKENLSANGLLDRVRESDKSEKQVTKEFLAMIDRHFKGPAIIAGSSIHQDRRFIRRWWPEVEKRLHYRMLDVSSLKVFMMGRHKMVLEKRDSHRALDDIRDSIKELNIYLEKLSRG